MYIVQVVGEPTEVLTLQEPEPLVSNIARSFYDEIIRKTLTHTSRQILTVLNPATVCPCSIDLEK